MPESDSARSRDDLSRSIADQVTQARAVKPKVAMWYQDDVDDRERDRLDEVRAAINELRSLTVGIDQTGIFGAVPGPVSDAILKVYNVTTRRIEYQLGLVCNVLEALVDEIYFQDELR